MANDAGHLSRLHSTLKSPCPSRLHQSTKAKKIPKLLKLGDTLKSPGFDRSLCQRRHTRKLLTFYILEQSAAAGAHITHLLSHPKLVDGCRGVTPTN